MGKQVIKEGSPALFGLIKILNLVFGVSALALIALGIWLWREFGKFHIIEIAFIGLGLLECLLVLFIFTAKTSVIKLRLYLFAMMVLFVAHVTVIAVTFATGPKIIEQVAKDSQQQIEELKKKLSGYLHVLEFYCIGVVLVMLLEMALTYCYIGSLRNRNFEFDYKFLDEDGNKMTLQQKNEQDRKKISQKTSLKREEYQNKYANYKEFKQRQNAAGN